MHRLKLTRTSRSFSRPYCTHEMWCAWSDTADQRAEHGYNDRVGYYFSFCKWDQDESRPNEPFDILASMPLMPEQFEPIITMMQAISQAVQIQSKPSPTSLRDGTHYSLFMSDTITSIDLQTDSMRSPQGQLKDLIAYLEQIR